MRGSENVECTDEALEVPVEVATDLVGLLLAPLELVADEDLEDGWENFPPRELSVEDSREYRPLCFLFFMPRGLSFFFFSSL